jgi:hypothetical protein
MEPSYNDRNHSTHTLGPPEPIIPCLEPTCIRHFFNRTGRSNHMRSHHPQFVPNPQQQANAPISSNSVSTRTSLGNNDLSSPLKDTLPQALDSRPQSRGSDHRNADEPGDFNVDMPFDDLEEEDQRLSSPTQEPSNTVSDDRAHDPAIGLRIKRIYHPIING